MKKFKVNKNYLKKRFYTTDQPIPKINKSKFDAKSIVNLKLEDGKIYSFCRCWQSKTFPLCDGSHKEFNKETGENMGSLKIILGDGVLPEKKIKEK